MGSAPARRRARAQPALASRRSHPRPARAQPHYHEGYETAIYLLQGEVQTLHGAGLATSCTNRAGDFPFIPAGVPHPPINLSPATDAIAPVARNDPDERASVRAYDPAG